MTSSADGFSPGRLEERPQRYTSPFGDAKGAHQPGRAVGGFSEQRVVEGAPVAVHSR